MVGDVYRTTVRELYWPNCEHAGLVCWRARGFGFDSRSS